MKKISAALVLAVLLSLLCGCGTAGCSTAEEAALTFVQATVENSPELFKSCVYPSMREEWSSSYQIDGDMEASVKEMRAVSSREVERSEIDDLEEEFGFTAKSAMVYHIQAVIYDDRRGEERTDSFETMVVQIGGRWYGIGWS